MWRYRLFWPDGSEAGDASYAINIKAGDLIWIPSPNRQLRVLELVPIDEEGSPYKGLLKVETT